MSRRKPASGSAASGRGRPVELPEWWLRALNEERGNLSGAEIAEKLTELTGEEFIREKVNDFLSGKVTTDRTLKAMLRLFPRLPPPMFEARSLEEARLYQQLAELHRRATETPEEPEQPPRVDETIEDTGDQRAAGRRHRSITKK